MSRLPSRLKSPYRDAVGHVAVADGQGVSGRKLRPSGYCVGRVLFSSRLTGEIALLGQGHVRLAIAIKVRDSGLCARNERLAETCADLERTVTIS